jgi:hypothetical protein
MECALSGPKEDFAETFEIFVKHRRSLDRFKARPRFLAKLLAVEKAAKGKTKDLGG